MKEMQYWYKSIGAVIDVKHGASGSMVMGLTLLIWEQLK